MSKKRKLLILAPKKCGSATCAKGRTLVRKIGKTTYRVMIHFSATSWETMSDKIKRILRNEIQQI